MSLPASLLQTVSKRQLLDRYGQHTQHCPKCLYGLVLVSRLISACKAVMASAFLGFCGRVNNFGVTRLAAGGLPTAATLAAVVVGVFASWLGHVCAEAITSAASFCTKGHILFCGGTLMSRPPWMQRGNRID
jgi:hypothetical protein